MCYPNIWVSGIPRFHLYTCYLGASVGVRGVRGVRGGLSSIP